MREAAAAPQPDIGQPGLGQDPEAELDGALNDQQVGNVRQDMFGEIRAAPCR